MASYSATITSAERGGFTYMPWCFGVGFWHVGKDGGKLRWRAAVLSDFWIAFFTTSASVWSVEFAYIVKISFIIYIVRLDWMLVAMKRENWSKTISHVFNGRPLLFCERLSASILFYFSILTLHLHELLNVLQIEERSNISNWCIDLYWPLQFWRSRA